jgi:hypothetical protein
MQIKFRVIKNLTGPKQSRYRIYGKLGIYNFKTVC